MRHVTSAVYTWMLVWMAAFVLVGTLVGYAPVVITSGSMEPVIRRGDTILTSTPDPVLYDAPTVITFTPDHAPDQLITHRVVGVHDRDSTMRTRGDANGQDDPQPVRPDQVQGVARWLVPAAGLPVLWLRDGAWLTLALWMLASVAAARWAFPRDPVVLPFDGAQMTRSEKFVAAAAGALAVGGVAILALGPGWAAAVVTLPPAGAWLVQRASRRAGTMTAGEQRVACSAALVLLAAAAAMPVASAAAFASNSPTSGSYFTAFVPRQITELYLFNTAAGGPSTTQATMPMLNQPLPPGPTPNYSTDAGANPGRFLPPGAAAVWRSDPVVDTLAASGTAEITWGVVNAGGNGPWRSRLEVNRIRGGASTTIASSDENINMPPGTGTVSFTRSLPFTTNLIPGDRIEVRLGAGAGGNNRSVHLLYGTTDWPARVEFDTPLTLP